MFLVALAIRKCADSLRTRNAKAISWRSTLALCWLTCSVFCYDRINQLANSLNFGDDRLSRLKPAMGVRPRSILEGVPVLMMSPCCSRRKWAQDRIQSICSGVKVGLSAS